MTLSELRPVQPVVLDSIIMFLIIIINYVFFSVMTHFLTEVGATYILNITVIAFLGQPLCCFFFRPVVV